MSWLPVLLGAVGVIATLVVVVLFVERLANARRPASREGDENGESVGSGMFGELVEIFQPSRAHLTAEKERQRLDIVQTPAEGAPFGVDLEAGVAYLPAPDVPAREDDDGAAPGGVAPSS